MFECTWYAHGTCTGAGNEHGNMPRASPFRRIEELSWQKPAKPYETKRDRRAACVQPTRFRGSAISVCAAPWPTWPCLAHLRVGWFMRSGLGLSNRIMAYASSSNIPCPQDIAPLRPSTILMASQTDFPDIVPTIRSTPLSYSMSHGEYSTKEITAIRPL